MLGTLSEKEKKGTEEEEEQREGWYRSRHRSELVDS